MKEDINDNEAEQPEEPRPRCRAKRRSLAFDRLALEHREYPAVWRQQEVRQRLFGEGRYDVLYTSICSNGFSHHVFRNGVQVDRQDNADASEPAACRQQFRPLGEFANDGMACLWVEHHRSEEHTSELQSRSD